jgi:hypothetical protein
MSTLTFSQTSQRPAVAPAAASTFGLVRDVLAALGEGFTAHQRYEQLRARGVPHADAAQRAFADPKRA